MESTGGSAIVVHTLPLKSLNINLGPLLVLEDDFVQFSSKAEYLRELLLSPITALNRQQRLQICREVRNMQTELWRLYDQGGPKMLLNIIFDELEPRTEIAKCDIRQSWSKIVEETRKKMSPWLYVFWLKNISFPGTLEPHELMLLVYLSEDGNRRGGFRNLLLDDWWLEFWEIILFVAGDVERNPGPRQMTDEQLAKIDNTALGKDDLFIVYDAIFGCRANWQNLCLALWISADDVSAITRKYSGEPDACLREGLVHWLQGDYDTEKHGRPTWRRLVDAVANTAGGNDHALALNIAKEHKAVKALLPQTSHHCDDLERAKKMSSAFSSMYCSIVRRLRANVNEVKDSLRYLTDPQCLDKLCVSPKMYEDATSTKDLLSRLCPRYINPKNTFVLEHIVTNFGSQRCKGLLKDYTDEFH